MSLNIYFHIDELARDAIVASALKKELNSRGHKLTYGNRLFTASLVCRFRHAFDVIIVPRPLFMGGIERLGENMKIPPVVILYTEAVGSTVDPKADKLTLLQTVGQTFMEGNCPYFDKVSAFLLWGNIVLNRIKKYYPEIVDKFTVVGHPRFDEKCTGLTMPEAECEKIRVGFITRMDFLNTYDGRQVLHWVVDSALEPVPYLYKNEETGDVFCNPDNNVVDEIYIQSSDIDVMLRIINRLDPNKYEVFLRVHPRENMDSWVHVAEKYNVNMKLTDWRMPFAHWAKSMDYVVGPASTCFFDCCNLGVKPISIQNINPHYYEHLKGSCAEEFSTLTKHIDKPDSIDDLLDLIKTKSDSFIPSDEIREILSLEVDYPGCKSSIGKIVDKCVALAEAENKNQLEKYINSVLFYFSSRLLTVLVHIIRWFQKKSEQSSSFLLTRKNKRFIDNLTGD